MDPDTKFVMRSNTSKDELVRYARSHRSSNNLPPIENLEDVVDDFICRHNPPGFCEEQNPSGPVRRFASMLPSKQQIVRFSQVLFDTWKRNGQNVVSQAEAERRAAICVRCPNNVSDRQCMSCEGIGDVLKQFIGHRTTMSDGRLWTCAVCGCFNKLAVHIDLDTLKRSRKEGDVYPVEIKSLDGSTLRCWRTE